MRDECCRRDVAHTIECMVDHAGYLADGRDERTARIYAMCIGEWAAAAFSVVMGRPCPWHERGVPEDCLAAMAAVRQGAA